MKKLLVSFLVLASLCLFAITAQALTSSGDFEYVLLKDNTAEITGYIGNAKSLEIPHELDGYTVSSIGESAFHACSFQSITIPDSIISINTNPFTYCNNLQEIRVSSNHPVFALIDGVLFNKSEKTLVCYPCSFPEESYAIPQGILSIGHQAFAFCSSLVSITIPDSVISIGDMAFDSCDSLSSIVIPDSVISIGSIAFYECKSLTSAILADSVVSLGSGVFNGCESLTSVTLSNSLTTIEHGTFSGCKSLVSITIPASITSIGEEAFSSCHSLTSITLPASVTSIEAFAFYDCQSLTSLTVPSSVTSIVRAAFSCCDALTVIVERDSYAHQWAVENGVKYNYTDALDWLNA